MRHARRRTVSILTAGCAALAVAALPALTSSASAGQSPRIEIQDTHPTWAVTSAEVANWVPEMVSIREIYRAPGRLGGLNRPPW